MTDGRNKPSPRRKLTVKQVESMRFLRHSGWTIAALADRFDVSQSTAWYIVETERIYGDANRDAEAIRRMSGKRDDLREGSTAWEWRERARLAEDVVRHADEHAAALTEQLQSARAVVAVQREALRPLFECWDNSVDDLGQEWVALAEHFARARAALDAEGVNEPGSSQTGNAGYGRLDVQPAPGSLTSPLDPARPWTCEVCGRKIAAYETCDICAAPRGYVEHGPEGPQAVYHAETPDAYLERGDR